MDRIFTIALFFTTLVYSFGQKRYDIRFPLDGHMRESIIVQPSTPPPPGGYPVVYMLHGTSGDGEKFYDISGWKELGEKENFITVFPTSLVWCFVEDGIEKHLTRWVNGSVIDNPCSGPPQDYIDDVKFLKLLAKLIADSLPVNRAKIFACGFSNGCNMIHKMANEAGEVFSALAGSSSSLAESDSSRPIKRVPLWTVVGTLDDRFIVPPFTELPFGGDTILGYLQKPLRRTLGCQGLDENYIKVETDSLHTYQFLNSVPGEVGAPYLFTLAKNMGHVFPNGSNYFFDGPKNFWEFFKRSTAVSTKEETSQNAHFKVYPNPTNDVVTIEWNNFKLQDPIIAKVFNATGQYLMSKTIKDSFRFAFSKNELGAGLFMVKLTQGALTGTQKFIIY